MRALLPSAWGSVAQTLKTLGHQSRCAAGSPGILLSIEAKVVCNVATTCAPSPTAAATRLIEPERTSPMAKMPRRLVSSGLRLSSQSPPVNTKPFASSAMSDPDSQYVFGSAPMNKNRHPPDAHITRHIDQRGNDLHGRDEGRRGAPNRARH